MASLLDPRRLPGMLAPEDTLRWYHAEYGGADGLLGAGVVAVLLAFVVGASGGSPTAPTSVVTGLLGGAVWFVAERQVGVVEIAVTDRGLHRRTGALRTRGTGWEFLPAERVTSVVESERYYRDWRRPDHGVRVTTEDGVELFFAVEHDFRAYLDAVDDVTADGVVRYPPRFRDGDGGGDRATASRRGTPRRGGARGGR